VVYKQQFRRVVNASHNRSYMQNEACICQGFGVAI